MGELAADAQRVAQEPGSPTKPYHHGDLRRALLAHAVDAITELGTSATSVREDVPPALGDDPLEVTRLVARHLRARR